MSQKIDDKIPSMYEWLFFKRLPDGLNNMFADVFLRLASWAMISVVLASVIYLFYLLAVLK